jgi:hypothetical protein
MEPLVTAVAPVRVDEKTNEIPVARELLPVPPQAPLAQVAPA